MKASDGAGSYHAASDWEHIGQDPLRRLLALLSDEHLKVMRLVCREWRAVRDEAVQILRPRSFPISQQILRHFPAVAVLDFSRCRHTSETPDDDLPASGEPFSLEPESAAGDVIGPLAALKKLTHLYLKGCRGMQQSLMSLQALQGLTKLDVSGVEGVRHGALLSISRLHGLRTLSLASCMDVRPSGFAALTSLQQLESLDLSHCCVSDSVMELLGRLSRLAVLRLSGCNQVSGAGLAHLSPLGGLHTLFLERCSGLREAEGTATGAAISGLTAVTSLNMSACPGISESTMAGIGCLSGLVSLKLDCCQGLDDSGLQRLSDLPCLAQLSFAGCKLVTSLGVGHVARIGSLRELNMGHCNGIDSTGIAALAALPSLDRLSLRCCMGLGDETSAVLSRMPSLRHLSLESCPWVSTASIRHLVAGLPCLTGISLSGCCIADQALDHLLGAPSLLVADISGCPSITRDAVLRLQHLRPSLRLPRSQP